MEWLGASYPRLDFNTKTVKILWLYHVVTVQVSCFPRVLCVCRGGELVTPKFSFVASNMLLRHDHVLAGVELLVSPEIHGTLQQRHHIWIECLPVRVLEMVLLAL